MVQDNEFEELKERLENVERQLKHRSKNTKAIKRVLIAILVVFLLLTTVGILQFISY